MVEAHVHHDGFLAKPTLGPEPPQLFEGDPQRVGAVRRKIPIWLIVLAVLIVCGAIGFYFWWRSAAPPAVPPPTVTAPAPARPPADALPTARYPIESPQAGQAPLPSLQDSDATVLDGIAGVVPGEGIDRILRREDVVRHIVATVDNLPRRSVATRLLPVRPVPGPFATTGSGGSATIAAENAARYAPYVRVAEAVDAKTLAALYMRFYPLFQQAYRELGYPNGNFNDRLVDAIDDSLATPVVQGPIHVIQPKVFYEYADPELEQRSAGQKIMMRMGSDNAARVKAKLTQFRREIVGPNATR
jgi:Protein of unknown function (DUF3014)